MSVETFSVYATSVTRDHIAPTASIFAWRKKAIVTLFDRLSIWCAVYIFEFCFSNFWTSILNDTLGNDVAVFLIYKGMINQLCYLEVKLFIHDFPMKLLKFFFRMSKKEKHACVIDQKLFGKLPRKRFEMAWRFSNPIKLFGTYFKVIFSTLYNLCYRSIWKRCIFCRSCLNFAQQQQNNVHSWNIKIEENEATLLRIGKIRFLFIIMPRKNTTIKIVAQRSQPLTILMKTLLQLTLKRLQSHIQPLYMLWEILHLNIWYNVFPLLATLLIAG